MHRACCSALTASDPGHGDKSRLYALDAPEVACISMEKARTPYEFRVKVSIVITIKEGLVVGMCSMRATLMTGTGCPRRSGR